MSTPHRSCFLCSPSPALRVGELANSFAMAGWGPVCPGYNIIAATSHVASLADAHAANPEVASEIARFRRNSDRLYGKGVLTEHGRIPVCVDESDAHDAHCYHGHALVFPTDIELKVDISTYFSRNWMFSEIDGALRAAANEEAYFLFSESVDSYTLFSGPLNLPRQFARMVVAHSIGADGLTDWRSSPRVEEAESYAAKLRAAWEAGVDRD